MKKLQRRLWPTYVPGSPRRPFAQHQVGDGVLGLVAPLQRRDTVQAKVAVGQQQRVEEQSHGVGRASLQPLAQVLQVLDTWTTTYLTTDASAHRNQRRPDSRPTR